MKDNDLLKMNLQYFAEGDDSSDGGKGNDDSNNDSKDSQNNSDDDKGDSGKKKTGKTYTEDELQKIIDDHKSKWQEKADNAKKLEKMSAEQKAKFKLDEANKKAEASSKELAKYKMQDTARDMAKDAGMELSHSDIQHVVTSDADTTKANIEWLSSYTNKLKKSLKSELLKGNPPKTNGTNLKNKKESYGARLAKQHNHKKVDNPYFK